MLAHWDRVSNLDVIVEVVGEIALDKGFDEEVRVVFESSCSVKVAVPVTVRIVSRDVVSVTEMLVKVTVGRLDEVLVFVPELDDLLKDVVVLRGVVAPAVSVPEVDDVLSAVVVDGIAALGVNVPEVVTVLRAVVIVGMAAVGVSVPEVDGVQGSVVDSVTDIFVNAERSKVVLVENVNVCSALEADIVVLVAEVMVVIVAVAVAVVMVVVLVIVVVAVAVVVVVVLVVVMVLVALVVIVVVVVTVVVVVSTLKPMPKPLSTTSPGAVQVN